MHSSSWRRSELSVAKLMPRVNSGMRVWKKDSALNDAVAPLETHRTTQCDPTSG